jgi:hypothetical protein
MDLRADYGKKAALHSMAFIKFFGRHLTGSIKREKTLADLAF